MTHVRSLVAFSLAVLLCLHPALGNVEDGIKGNVGSGACCECPTKDPCYQIVSACRVIGGTPSYLNCCDGSRSSSPPYLCNGNPRAAPPPPTRHPTWWAPGSGCANGKRDGDAH